MKAIVKGGETWLVECMADWERGGKMSKDSEQHYHDKGEQDKAEGTYDPPHERVEDLVHDIVAGQSDSDRADQDAYQTGRDNVK